MKKTYLQSERILVDNESNPPVYGNENLYCTRKGGQCLDCKKSGYQPIYHCQGCKYLEYEIEK